VLAILKTPCWQSRQLARYMSRCKSIQYSEVGLFNYPFPCCYILRENRQVEDWFISEVRWADKKCFSRPTPDGREANRFRLTSYETITNRWHML
jgi:hypothetical protein